MRLVLDTNVLVAAFLSRGQCSDIFKHCAREHTLVTSAFLLNEFRETLIGKLGFPASKTTEAVRLLRLRSRVIVPEPLPQPICRDPADDHVLAAAVSGGCACLVTGDEDLLVLEHHRGVQILRPAAFWRYEASQRGPPG